MEINKFIFLATILIQALFLHTTSEPIQDKQALLDLIQTINHNRSLNWAPNSSACTTWTGVTCNHDESRVIALRLPAIGLKGLIPFNTIGRLTAIQILSLRSNGLSGTFPSDFSNLQNLTYLYLQSNRFSGPLPSNFSVWKNLSVLDLSNNGFNGSIPSSILNLTHLGALNLSNNSLSGEIPDLNLPSLELLDISNNNLTGTVPLSLQRFPASSFSGNHLSPENSPPPVLPPNSQPSKSSSKISEPAILGIVIGGCILGFVILALLLLFCYSKKAAEDEESATTTNQNKGKAIQKSLSESRSRNSTGLVFFEGLNSAFDLEDLLRASAEVLGKGTAITYKAALEDSTVIAVKRFKENSVTKREFEQQMELVGSIRHENVVALRAYYYSKEEKLMVYDFYNQGSASFLLHSKRGENRTPLDWETRVKIAIGAARGIAYIHSQAGGKLVHGNIKASNIFLNSDKYGCVSDLGLAMLINQVAPQNSRTPGYRAPEVTNTRKVSQATDVYSYGVLLLELLTGKSPVNSTGSGGDDVGNLVRWVNSVIREEWTAEVFDTELLSYPNIEEEMVEMLQLGMACAAKMPDQRPIMSDVVRMAEDIRRVSSGNRPSTETKSEVSTPTSIQMTPAGIGPIASVP